ncbi:MAG: nuclear transport factor 2 family protein [Novosphingobium sp.]
MGAVRDAGGASRLSTLARAVPFAGPREDRFLIRELYDAYSDATMRQDRDAYLACWTEEGVRIAPEGTCHGKAAIARYWDEVWGFVARIGFFTEVGSIAVQGTSASARIHCREIVETRQGAVWKVVGRYDDTLTKTSDRWVFEKREYTLLINEIDPKPTG